MRTLLLDNHDSFTWNLFGLLAEVNGCEPVVLRNDEVTAAELAAMAGEFDNLVVGPGPGRPERDGDFGVCAAAIREATVPVLGVCLGHQGIGWLAGGRVVHAPEPVHGRVGTMRLDGSDPLFAGIPGEFGAVRYHSLCLEADSLPEELAAIAWAEEDGVLMAVAHRRLPRWGVQFHPESVGTEFGRRLLANFRDLTPRLSPRAGRASNGIGSCPMPDPPTSEPEFELRWREMVGDRDGEAVFEALYEGERVAFWLDSAVGGRFSFLGAPGPLGELISYETVTTESRPQPIFDSVKYRLSRISVAANSLPFDFDCGLVGYLGYELKAETGGEAAHRASTPDAAFVFCDRLVALDHEDARTYLVALCPRDDAAAAREADVWLDAAVASLSALPLRRSATAHLFRHIDGKGAPGAPLRLARDEAAYLGDIAQCKRALADGESYELCLTNKVRTETELEPFALYKALRRANPAPYAAFLRLGPELSVLSSSPERFLRIDRDGVAEARPIKGTAARVADPAADAAVASSLAADPKQRAENLMIVDLLRNDLGRVCEPGSVEVPRLMEVESFETVHQLVSTVRGRLRPGASPVDAVRAAFPPGSMTGAPKERTMAILDRLEGEARGVYAGAIGYFGLGGGVDLAVAIRTLVLDGEGNVETGAGGAIVAGSDPDAEFEEMLLKAWAPLRALVPGAPRDYSRSRFSAESSRVTPRKSITSGAAATSAS
jgi:para-aminobenzoate synthetase